MKVANCCQVPSIAHKTCYRAQCYKTANAFAKSAGLTASRFSVAFQSRLGKEPWMQPYTDKEIERLARGGVRKLLVICPAFVTDCLETLEEIGMRGKEIFLKAGGSEFQLIPCLNTHPKWVSAVSDLVAPFVTASQDLAVHPR